MDVKPALTVRPTAATLTSGKVSQLNIFFESMTSELTLLSLSFSFSRACELNRCHFRQLGDQS